MMRTLCLRATPSSSSCSACSPTSAKPEGIMTAPGIFFRPTSSIAAAQIRDRKPTGYLFKNNRDGTFTDVTAKAGLSTSGWGQACCVGDYDNDGFDDLFVLLLGQTCCTTTTATARSRTSRRRRVSPGTATRVGRGLRVPRLRPGRPARSFRRELRELRSGQGATPGRLGVLPLQRDSCALRPAWLRRRHEPPLPQSRRRDLRGRLGESGIARPRGPASMVFVDATGRRADRTEWAPRSRTSTTTAGPTSTSPATRAPSLLYRNNHDGTFREVAVTRGLRARRERVAQAGMGVGVGDYDGDGSARHRPDQFLASRRRRSTGTSAMGLRRCEHQRWPRREPRVRRLRHRVPRRG